MSKHVRDVFRATVEAAAAPLPYFDTIGQPHDLNRAPDQWVTVEFPLATSSRISIGYPAQYREAGGVIVHVVSRSGVGDSDAMDAAEDIRAYFEGPYIDDVRITEAYPPSLVPTDDGEWLDVTMAINYTYDYFVNSATT